MLAYRHAFHAGNHADVLKHHILAEALGYMVGKGKPLRVIDTHAGAGGYRLKGAEAQKKAEYRHGIGQLWSRAGLPAPLARYVELVQRFNLPLTAAAPNEANGANGADSVDATVAAGSAAGKLERGMTPPLALYPGSPSVARELLGAGDALHLYELHPADARTLAAHFGGDRRCLVHHADGFAALAAELPPVPRRALVLIDPSYELAADYAKVVAALREALTRFAEGVYMIWYPQVSRLEAAQLPKRLAALARKASRGWLHARLTVQPLNAQGFGLAGSGVFIVNPPYTLHATLAQTLPFLTQALAQYDGASYLLDEQPA